MGIGLLLLSSLVALMQGVWCQTWDVTLPRSIVAVAGSCVTVPCRFELPGSEAAKLQNCSNGGVWKRGHYFNRPIFSGLSPSSSGVQGQIDGDLTRKNCTTTFQGFTEAHSDSYFFRLECPNELKFSFTKGVNISVAPAPPPPRLTSTAQVSEGGQVRLVCSAPAPCPALPPALTWLPRDSSMRQDARTQQSSDGQVTVTSTLTFTASARHHNQSVSCWASYPLTGGGSTRPAAANLTLSVLYAPRSTAATLSTSGPVSEGRAVAFTCRSDANPPVSRYTWFRADGGQLTKLGEGDLLVRQVSRTDGGLYLCEARSQRGSQRSRPVFLDVSASAGSSCCAVQVPYVICGVLLLLLVLTVAVDVYKHQSVSRRLKQIELKGEHTYADLRIGCVDYDQLQLQQPKTAPHPEVSNYENLQISSTSAAKGSRGRPEGTS